MASILDILTPSRVRDVISRIKTPGSVMARHFGFDIDGKNVMPAPDNARIYTYDIYDNVRASARGAFPNSPANQVANNAIGNNSVAIGRSYEKIVMDYFTVSNIREIGKDAGTLDVRGQKYISKQAETLRQRADNFREFYTGSLFRGGLAYFIRDGNHLVPTYTASGAAFSIDLQIPAANKLIGDTYADGLAMGTGSNCIDGTWSNASTNIPQQLAKISRGFQLQVGCPLTDIYCDSLTFQYVLQNTYVRQLAGTSNPSFLQYAMEQDKAPDGSLTGLTTGQITGMSWLRWHIYDGVIETGTGNTATRVIPEGYATFTIDRNQGGWLLGVEGSEIVKDHNLAPPVTRRGLYAWMMEFAAPAQFELHAVQNFAIELNVPKAIACARVV